MCVFVCVFVCVDLQHQHLIQKTARARWQREDSPVCSIKRVKQVLLYGNESDEAQAHIICKTYYNVISAPLGNTTNLLNHLLRNHKVPYDELVKKQKDKTTTPTTSVQTSISIRRIRIGTSKSQLPSVILLLEHFLFCVV